MPVLGRVNGRGWTGRGRGRGAEAEAEDGRAGEPDPEPEDDAESPDWARGRARSFLLRRWIFSGIQSRALMLGVWWRSSGRRLRKQFLQT